MQYSGWLELTTVCIQKYAKSCVLKHSLMTPHYLLEASGAPVFTLHQGGWITVHKVVLSQFFLSYIIP